METVISCAKYSQVAGPAIIMLGQDCTMISCYNVHFSYSCQGTANYQWLYVHIQDSNIQCMHGRECCCRMTVFNLYCSLNYITLLHNPDNGSVDQLYCSCQERDGMHCIGFVAHLVKLKIIKVCLRCSTEINVVEMKSVVQRTKHG